MTKVTELSFLIELLLNHKLPKATQLAIKGRIDEIQGAPVIPIANGVPVNPMPTIAIKPIPPILPDAAPPIPIENVAQTPEAQAALAHRQAMINTAANRKVMPGTNHAPKTHGSL